MSPQSTAQTHPQRHVPLRRLHSLPGLALLAPLFLALFFALSAAAQHEGTTGTAPALPSGEGRLTVQVVDPSGSAEIGALSLALYALSPDGTPGLGAGETDAEGRFVFEDLSTDPQIVYLVGARYAEIPFGERFTFEAGERDARVEIEISAPSDRLEGVQIEELRARVDWLGDHVVVREQLRIQNPGSRVILLPETESERAIFLRPLPEQATDFSPGATAIGNGLFLADDGVRFRGPLYPGEQQVEYSYRLPADPGTRSLALPLALREPAARVVVVAGTSGLGVEGPGLIPSSEVTSDSGRKLASWARAGLAAGGPLEVVLALPELRGDPSLVTLPRGDLWIESDDTRLSATVELQLEVEPGSPVAGTPQAPLLRIDLPSDARLNGVAPEAEALGLVPRSDGGFDVIGPIAPGTTSLRFSWRLPTGPDGVRLDLAFPREVATLNVLIADTGLSVGSSRLHRRRPFRSGTRNYLHREAFNVAPDERVDLTLEPLRDRGLPRAASLGLTLVAVAGAAFFLSAPLRGRDRPAARGGPPAASPVQAEREALYSTIADLDHDFETGKLEEGDYREMRDALRGRAIELLRAEREKDAAPSANSGEVDPARDASATAATAPGPFCPSCGGRLGASWRFCSHCGVALGGDADGVGG
jgi:hypothetical protein